MSREELRVQENAYLEELVDYDNKVKKQKVLERFERFSGRKLSISEEKLDRLVNLSRQIVQERWDAESAERQAYENAMIPTGIKKGEDYKRTYTRQYNQQLLDEYAAVNEAVIVR